ncbi:MAG: hypothetical protein RIS76_4187, partial [Verrucomicrobiota bacterium]
MLSSDIVGRSYPLTFRLESEEVTGSAGGSPGRRIDADSLGELARPGALDLRREFARSMTPPLHSLRAGVIGTGFIGPVHVEALKRLGVQVTAICGSTRSAQACADRWGIPE